MNSAARIQNCLTRIVADLGRREHIMALQNSQVTEIGRARPCGRGRPARSSEHGFDLLARAGALSHDVTCSNTRTPRS